MGNGITVRVEIPARRRHTESQPVPAQARTSSGTFAMQYVQPVLPAVQRKYRDWIRPRGICWKHIVPDTQLLTVNRSIERAVG